MLQRSVSIFQGRVDDLWAWFHMLIELHIGLPWNRLTDEKQILAEKLKTTPAQLIRVGEKSPPSESRSIEAFAQFCRIENDERHAQKIAQSIIIEADPVLFL